VEAAVFPESVGCRIDVAGAAAQPAELRNATVADLVRREFLAEDIVIVLGLVRERGTVRTSITFSTGPRRRSSTNCGMVRVEWPIV
jgi:hypothetical protein